VAKAATPRRAAIDFGEDTRALFRGPSESIFLIKVNN